MSLIALLDRMPQTNVNHQEKGVGGPVLQEWHYYPCAQLCIVMYVYNLASIVTLIC